MVLEADVVLRGRGPGVVEFLCSDELVIVPARENTSATYWDELEVVHKNRTRNEFWKSFGPIPAFKSYFLSRILRTKSCTEDTDFSQT
jgi:hypothetical protein